MAKNGLNRGKMVLAFAFVFFFSLFVHESTYAQVNTLSISLSGELSINLMPGQTSSVSQTITVETSNYTGYTLFLSTSDNNVSLQNTNDSTMLFPTITLTGGESILLSEFPSSSAYGYSLDDTHFKPVTSGMEIGSNNQAATDDIVFTIGAKAGANAQAGTYQKTFILTAIANDAAYEITYDANTNDTVDNLPGVQSNNTSQNTVQLLSIRPQRDHYLFLGWNEDSDATTAAYQPSDIYTLDQQAANCITLYAIWSELSFTVSGNPTEWTNQSATLTVVPASAIQSYIEAYSFDGGTTWSSSASQVFPENQSNIIVLMRDIYGDVSAGVSVDITKIDKVAPTISFNNARLIATLDESTSFDSLVTVSDSLSGVSSDGLVVVRGKGTVLSNTNFFTYPGLYAISMSATDRAGNVTAFDTSVLIRWPTGAKYVLKKTVLDGDGVVGVGIATDSTISGLYQDTVDTGLDSSLPFSSEYYYSGPDTASNYLDFGGYTYSILNLAINNDVKLISDVSSQNVRYSSRKIFESGSNMDPDDWETWYSGKYLYYSNDSQYRTFSDEELAHIDEATFYAGRFTKDATPTLADTIDAERNSAVNLGADSAAFHGHFALPTVSDYIKACNEMNSVYNISTTQSNSSIFKTCSWLQTSAEQWTINSKNDTSTDNDYWVLDPTILNNNRIVSRTYYYYENYRPVFYLTGETILSGSGTSGDPYTVQEDWSWFDDVQILQ